MHFSLISSAEGAKDGVAEDGVAKHFSGDS